MKWKHVLLFVLTIALVAPAIGQAQEKTEEPDKLVVLWTSGEREVALKMVFMYTLNAQKEAWWDEVSLVIWGPSAQLAAVDSDIQEYLKKMDEAGVTLKACQACSDPYGVTKKLESMNVDVKYMGEPLTQFLKKPDTKVVTF